MCNHICTIQSRADTDTCFFCRTHGNVKGESLGKSDAKGSCILAQNHALFVDFITTDGPLRTEKCGQ